MRHRLYESDVVGDFSSLLLLSVHEYFYNKHMLFCNKESNQEEGEAWKDGKHLH